MTKNYKLQTKSWRLLGNKRKRDIENSTQYAYQEIENDALQPTERLTSETLGNLTERFYQAYQQDKLTKHDTLEDQYMSIIHSKHWKAVDLKAYLTEIYKDNTEGKNKIKSAKRGTGSASLENMLISYWKSNSISCDSLSKLNI